MYGFIALVFFVVMILAILVWDKVGQIEGGNSFLRDFYSGRGEILEKVFYTCCVLLVMIFISLLWLPLLCLPIVCLLLFTWYIR